MVVKRFGKTVARFRPEHLEYVQVLSHSTYDGPFPEWVIKPKPRLHSVMIASTSGDISLVFWDRGFSDAVRWLSSHHWRMDEAIERSFKMKLGRHDVERGEKNIGAAVGRPTIARIAETPELAFRSVELTDAPLRRGVLTGLTSNGHAVVLLTEPLDGGAYGGSGAAIHRVLLSPRRVEGPMSADPSAWPRDLDLLLSDPAQPFGRSVELVELVELVEPDPGERNGG